MAEEEKKEEKKPEKAAAAKTEKKKLNVEELAARISLYLAFITLFVGVLVKLDFIQILGIKPSNFILMTMVWLLTSIAILLWQLNKKTK